MTAFYGSDAKHTYFQGCSNGGREGLQMVERYPEEFDGVIAGAPAFNLSNAAIAEAWNTDEIAKISPKKGDGTADLLLQNQATNQAAVWYLKNGAFAGSAAFTLTPPSGWKIVAPR